jgi:hypothetical protein
MFCFADDNKIISGIENIIVEPDFKKLIFNTLPFVRRYRPDDNLLSPSTLYMFGLSTGLLPSSSHPNSLIIFI